MKNKRGACNKTCKRCCEKNQEWRHKNWYKVCEWGERDRIHRKVICVCGASYSKYNVTNHCTLSRTHLAWVARQAEAITPRPPEDETEILI